MIDLFVYRKYQGVYSKKRKSLLSESYGGMMSGEGFRSDSCDIFLGFHALRIAYHVIISYW